MVRWLRNLLLISMLLYGGGFAAALHQATHHSSEPIACIAHANEHDAATPASAPADEEDHDDCPECTLLLIGGFIGLPSASAPILNSAHSVALAQSTHVAGRLVIEDSRPRAPPHHS